MDQAKALELSSLRFKETSEAIGLWVAGQKRKGSKAEAIGVARAFLVHAAMAIAVAFDLDESDAKTLGGQFMEVAAEFIEAQESDG